MLVGAVCGYRGQKTLNSIQVDDENTLGINQSYFSSQRLKRRDEYGESEVAGLIDFFQQEKS